MNQTLDSRPVQIDLVTQAHGLDSSQYTFNYVAGWALEGAGQRSETRSIDQVVKDTGDRVISATHRILSQTQPAADPDASAPDPVALRASPGPAVWETVDAHNGPRPDAVTPASASRGRRAAGIAR